MRFDRPPRIRKRVLITWNFRDPYYNPPVLRPIFLTNRITVDGKKIITRPMPIALLIFAIFPHRSPSWKPWIGNLILSPSRVYKQKRYVLARKTTRIVFNWLSGFITGLSLPVLLHLSTLWREFIALFKISQMLGYVRLCWVR